MNRREKLEEILVSYKTEQAGLTTTISSIEKIFKKKEIGEIDSETYTKVNQIASTFSELIHPIRKVDDKAVANIILRLKTYTTAECIQAIQNFSQDEWNMRNNGHRSLDWFFDKDSRVETYLHMVPKSSTGQETPVVKIGNKVYRTEAELVEAEKKGEIRYDGTKYISCS